MRFRVKLRAHEENPIEFYPPKCVKKGGHWAKFIEEMADVFDVECTNVQRNWNYMHEVRSSYLTRQAIAGKVIDR